MEFVNLKGEKPKVQDDDIQKLIGGFGKYQWLLLLLTMPCRLSSSSQSLGIVFQAPPMSYECADVMYQNNSQSNQCPCENPIYNNDIFEDNMITKWNLICDKKWLVNLSQTVIMLGILVGSLISGDLSDRFGRKRCLLSASALEVTAGIAASITPEFWSFMFFRFLIGCSVGAILITSFVLVMEFTGKEYRELNSCLLQISYNMGFMLLPLYGYFFKSWYGFNLCLALPATLMLCISWILPETPRWLLTTGKTKEAISVIKKAAAFNGRKTDMIDSTVDAYSCKNIGSTAQEGTMINLFKTPNLRNNMICITANWTVCSFGFYGISQFIGQLSGNIFVNVTISATLSSFGTFLGFVLLKLFKRRTSMILSNLITSVCLLVIAIVPRSYGFVSVVMACIGNMGAFAGFIVVYLYTVELFPTVVRNAAMGIASMFSRFGSMVAPFVLTLGSTAIWLPPAIFGSAPLIAAILCLFLPETKNKALANTLEEGENINVKK